MSIFSLLEERLRKQKHRHLFRSLLSPSNLTDFTSNDYLGFSRSPELKDIFHAAFTSLPSLGSTGSRLLTGHSILADETEQYVASYHNMESALIFNSGYTANLGLISTLVSHQDRVIYDLYIHASIHDGIRLSKAQKIPFRHNDMQHLEKRLSQPFSGNTFVCVESIYSLHGSIAPLTTLCELCKLYGAYLIVDEAHALGIVGSKGEGYVTSLGLQNDVTATIYTFGKALGIHGAAVTGSALLKEYLINFCRPFIYTTAPPPHFFKAIHLAYQYNKTAATLRERLHSRISYLQTQAMNLTESAFQKNSHTPIQPLYISGNVRARITAEQFRTAGFDVRPIVSPTVKQKEELLRICLHAFNTQQEIDDFLNLLNDIQTSSCKLSLQESTQK
ncbi:aminotransferase class I/II-fold pyridoxal phosphate-dependent enzyme [Chlamydia avium]|nr:pyridoxal phosphate-dependent aminotransferase family protein [Chlamydia avium]